MNQCTGFIRFMHEYGFLSFIIRVTPEMFSGVIHLAVARPKQWEIQNDLHHTRISNVLHRGHTPSPELCSWQFCKSSPYGTGCDLSTVHKLFSPN